MVRNYSTVGIVIIVIVSFMMSTFASLWSLAKVSSDNIKEINTMIAARVYIAIDRSLREPVTVASTMAHDSFLIETLDNESEENEAEAVAEMKRYLSGLRSGLGYDTAFVISEKTGNYYTYDGIINVIDPENDEYDRWYTTFTDAGDSYEVNVNRDNMNQDIWTAFSNARIERDGVLYGVCGVGVEMTDLQQLFSDFEDQYDVKISIVDSDGIVQIDTQQSSIGNEYFDTDVIGDESDDYIYSRKGNDEFTVTRYIEDLGWYLVVSSNGADTHKRFIRVILLNLALCILILIIIASAMRVSVHRVDFLHSASMIDSLTGMHNRRAYEDEKELLSKGSLPADLILMTADVNGLKDVNDNLGHEAGDELIKGAADCLGECFSSMGTVFRTGGDEFAGILNGSESELEDAKVKLQKILSEWEGEKCGSLAISCGYASVREFPSEGIEELSGISDERMYMEKREYYKTHSRRRKN